MSQRDIKVLLQPGQSYPVRAAGEFVFCKEAGGEGVTLRINGASLVLLPGDVTRPGMPFDNFDMENTTAYAQQVVLVVGMGAYNRQIIRGEVTVYNGLIGGDGALRRDTRSVIEAYISPDGSKAGMSFTRGNAVRQFNSNQGNFVSTFYHGGMGAILLGRNTSPSAYRVYSLKNMAASFTGTAPMATFWDPVLAQYRAPVRTDCPICWTPSGKLYAVDAPYSAQGERWLFVSDGTVSSAAEPEGKWSFHKLLRLEGFDNAQFYNVGMAYDEQRREFYTVKMGPSGQGLLRIGLDGSIRFYQGLVGGSYGMGIIGRTLYISTGDNIVTRVDISGPDPVVLGTFTITGEVLTAPQSNNSQVVSRLVVAAQGVLWGWDNRGQTDAHRLYRVEPETVSGVFFGSITAGGCETGASLIRADRSAYTRIQPGAFIVDRSGRQMTARGALAASVIEGLRGTVPWDYLDHVYGVEVVGQGINRQSSNYSFAAAELADDFTVQLPARVRLTVDASI